MVVFSLLWASKDKPKGNFARCDPSDNQSGMLWFGNLPWMVQKGQISNKSFNNRSRPFFTIATKSKAGSNAS